MQLALGRAGRARVQRDHAAGGGRVHEERQPDRDLEARPDLVGHVEVGQPHRAVAGRPVLGIARAQRPAALARAHDPALDQLQQVAVVGRDGGPAEVAALAVGRSARRRAPPRPGSGQPAQAGHHLRPPARRPPRRRRRRHARAPAAAVLAHAASATLTLPCSRSSGTGSSCSRSSSIERPARGRKYMRSQCGQRSAPRPARRRAARRRSPRSASR